MIFTSGRSLQLFILLIIRILRVNSQNNEWNNTNITPVERLRMQLFLNYDANDIPMKNSMEKTNVSLGLSLNYIDINEFNGKLSLYGWILMRWDDMYRTWDPNSFDNITKLHVNPKEIWKPSVSLLNDDTNKSHNPIFGKSYAILHNNGTIVWAPNIKYSTYCNINLKLWPYDTQYCNVQIITWSLIEMQVNYLQNEQLYDEKHLKESTKWEIIDVKSTYQIMELQNYIEFEFHLKRRNALYSVVISTSTISLVLLTLSTFWLPPPMVEKILLNASLIVVNVIFLMFFGQEIPMMASTTPLIVVFYSSLLVMLSISIVVAIAVHHISMSKYDFGFIAGALNGPLGQIMLLTQFNFENHKQTINHSIEKETLDDYDNNISNDDHNTLDVDNLTYTMRIKNASKNHLNCLLIAVAIDRAFFAIFCITFLILATMYVF